MLSARPLIFHAKPGIHPLMAFILILFSFFLPSAQAADPQRPEKATLPPVHNLGRIVITAHGTEGTKGIAIDPTATSVVLDSYTSPRSPQTVKDVLESIPGTTGFIHVSKAFRVPTAMEFNWMGAPTGKYIDPETAMEYEGGIIQDLGKENSLRLAYYYYEIDDYIVLNRNPMPRLYAGEIEKTIFNADFLLDKDYEEQYHVPAPERAFGVHVSYWF